MKPTKYVAWFEIRSPSGFDVSHKDFKRLVDALKFKNKQTGYCEVFERIDIRDITPANDPAGLIWAWDEIELKK